MPDAKTGATPASSASKEGCSKTQATPQSDDRRLEASVIVPHLNTPERLERLLKSLATQELPGGQFEVIVVDNGSTAPLDALQARWPDVRFLHCPTRGPGPARNMGVAAARADRLAFIDADMRAGPGWLAAGLAALARTPSGHVGGDVRIDAIDPDQMTGTEAFEAVFAYRMDRYIAREGFTGTGNLFITRALFEAAGPFGGIGTQEDKDFGQRATRLGRPPVFAPDAVAFHPARSSLAEMRTRWQRLSVQALNSHLRDGGSLAAWRLRALLVMASGLGHAPRLLLSPRIKGVRARLRGLGVLLAIRWVRGLDMLRHAKSAAMGCEPGAEQWNT
ncbi:glycosyltransferase [Thermaurantiacus sp.]